MEIELDELLKTAITRLQVMQADTELLTHAFAGAVVLAAAEDARATASIDYDDRCSLDDQRKTERRKVALQLAWGEARDLAHILSDRLESLRGLQDRMV
jgi:hypothetical protein